MASEVMAGLARGGFATTRWSLVLNAGDDSSGSRRALEELCAQYWYPLYAYARRLGNDSESARDLTQAFFAKLLEKQDLRAADPARGRFRTFLLTAMKNFLGGEWRKGQALKRGGGLEILALDFDAAEASYQLEPRRGLDPEAIYERRWALGLLEQAVADLREQYQNAGKGELFEALKGALGGDAGSLPYSEIAARLGQSEGALRTATSRLRSRWRKRLRTLVAETVGDAADVQDELQYLIAAVGRG